MPYYGKENIQPQLYAPEYRDLVSCDKFTGFEKSVEKFKKTSKIFEESENQFFDAIIYGIMFSKSNSETINKNKITEVIAEDFYHDLLEIKDEIKLDIGHFLDILIDVLLLIKFLLSIIFILNFLNDEICSDFFSKKGTGKK